MRADATRNRARILDAARAQIAIHGLDASMDDIASAAGVAVGTVYRHFAAKDDLVAAIVVEHVSAIADDAEACLARARDGSDASTELFGLFSRVVDWTAANPVLKSIAATPTLDGPQGPDEQRALVAVTELVERGIADGHIRPDLTVEDLYLVMSTAPTGVDAAARQRWLNLLTGGLAAPSPPTPSW